MLFEFKLPDVGEGVVEGEIVRWLIEEGDLLNEEQPMVEVMTDKATVEIPSPVTGRVVKRIGSEGETVEVGDTLVVIETDQQQVPAPAQVAEIDGSAAERAAAPAVQGRKTKAVREGAAGLATPAVRRLARELGVDLTDLKGSGPGGRVSREDVERSARIKGPPTLETPAEALAGEEEVPYRGIRKKVGEHLLASKRLAPHYTYVEEVDVTQMVKLREVYLRVSEGGERRLTYLPFLVRAVAEGLKQFPLLNSALDEEKGVIRLKKSYNVGIATDTEEGLVVPVVKNADRKSILELAGEIAELSEAARKGKLKLEDLRDGTFTITSLGPLGGVMGTPIINYPEVAILGVHKIAARPVVRDGQVAIAQVMNLSLSLDHRVVDGAVGARFLHHVIPYLENPGLLLLTS